MTAPRPRIPAARPRLVALLVAVVSAVGASGCGQAQQVRDAGVYTARLNRIIAGLVKDQRQANDEFRVAEVPADVDRGIRQLSGDLDRVRADLRKVKPPSVVRQLHRDLTTSYGRLTEPLQRLQILVRRGRRTELGRGQLAYRRENAAIQRTIDTILIRINAQLARLSD